LLPSKVESVNLGLLLGTRWVEFVLKVSLFSGVLLPNVLSSNALYSNVSLACVWLSKSVAHKLLWAQVLCSQNVSVSVACLDLLGSKASATLCLSVDSISGVPLTVVAQLSGVPRRNSQGVVDTST
jgi:hypothetical protein